MPLHSLHLILSVYRFFWKVIHSVYRFFWKVIHSVHRFFWKVVNSVSKSRKQDDLVVPALKKIGCHYLAYTMNHCYKSKGKYYDGSTTLRMTGNDCKRLEAGISTFLATFLKTSIGETFHHISATRLAVLNRIVRSFFFFVCLLLQIMWSGVSNALIRGKLLLQ